MYTDEHAEKGDEQEKLVFRKKGIYFADALCRDLLTTYTPLSVITVPIQIIHVRGSFVRRFPARTATIGLIYA